MPSVARWISWRRVAIAGLGALLGVMLLGSQLPDPEQLTPDELSDMAAHRPRTLAIARVLPVGRALGSPWLMTVPVALAAAIAWNLADRVRARRSGPPRPSARFAPQAEWHADRPASDVAAGIELRLTRRRYRVFARADDGAFDLVGRRGAMGFWGSVAFHVGLVTALAAITASLFGEWRGEIHLVEGEAVALDEPGAVTFHRRGPLAPSLRHTTVQLARCEVRYQDDRFPVDYRADLAVIDPAGRRTDASVRVNGAAAVDGARLLLNAFGIAPVLTVDRGSERLADGPISLSVREGREDVIAIPGTPDRMAVRWFGDVVRQGKQTSSLSDLPRNPALGFRFQPEGSPELSVLIRRGQAAAVGPYRIAFHEPRYWVDLVIERDPGAPILLVALVVASLGLLVRFWDHDREIRVRVSGERDGAHVAAAARSRYFPALITRELDDLRAHT